MRAASGALGNNVHEDVVIHTCGGVASQSHRGSLKEKKEAGKGSQWWMTFVTRLTQGQWKRFRNE